MTLLSATACFLILLITTTIGLSLDTYYDHASNAWNHHSVEEPSLTLWNLSLKACVERCQIRKACRAVNHCRTRRSCQLLETDSGELVSQNVSDEFNVFVRMGDVRLKPQFAHALSACNCTVNQTCSLNTSSCIVKECRRLKVANGVILFNMVKVGAKVTVVCNDLYKLNKVSQDQSVCQTDGQWFPAITCAPYTACGPPPPVNNATFMTFTNVSDVISAGYECDVGYDTPSALNGTNVECLSNTTWGAIGFECLAICDAPPKVSLATVSPGENLHGFTKIYTCDAGHAVNGSANITCQADATWSQIQFECIAECRRLKVANGVILGNMVSVGARVKVVCNNLYKLYPPSQDQSVCQTDGQWLPAITCAPYTACGPPRTVDAATFVTFTNVSNVISAVYACDVGYGTPSAFNVMSVECLSNSTTWGTIGFECLAVCDAPPKVTLATVSAGENLHGFTKIYTCDAGYAVNGSANITCQADATWSQIEFECIANCGDPLLVPNGVVLPGNTVEESVRNYTCNTGYAPNSTSTLATCQMDGNWTAVDFACIIDCGIPPTLTNAEVSSGGTSEGDNRTYTCTNGHVFRNIVNTNITCQSDSMWSTASFDCLWDCGPAPTVHNAAITVSDTVEASVGTYTCNTGFVANYTTTSITCQAGATWSNLAFYCIIDCGIPPSETNAFVQTGNTTLGTDRNYTCDAGYAPSTTTTVVTCQSSGNWTPAMFTCLKDCGPPTVLPNSQVTGSGTLDGATQTYSCMSGYVMRNNVTVDTTCQTGGTWTAPTFDCMYDCGSPPTMTNGTVSDGDNVTGWKRTYICDIGYGTNGTATITCLDGTGWSTVTSTCTELMCDTNWHKIGESCYYTPGNGVDFESEVSLARDFCHSQNAYLVQLETPAESEDVVAWFFGSYSTSTVWLGMTDEAVDGTWLWMNSSVQVNWTNWADGQPDGGADQNYCVLWGSEIWYDRPYDSDRQPLCEKSAKPT